MFEVFEHTADLGLRVRAKELDELFVEAARGLTSLIVTDLNSVRLVEERSIQVAGTDREYLLFDWLTELLVTFETNRLLLVEFQVNLTATGLTAACRGECLDTQRHQLEHEVKAITYHGLKVEQIRGEWIAEVIVDI
jgi:SHS2 domain-containing protein